MHPKSSNPPSADHKSATLISSFGRRRGRKLRSGKQSLMDTLLPKLTLALPESGLLKVSPETWLEIGFGSGEHLAFQAARQPGVTFIGCEPYVNGIGELLKKIEAEKLSNIGIFPDDVRKLIACLPDASLSRVFILYPDPWPKTRHHKRRLISNAFLDDLARVMKPGAELRLATDHADYATWMLERLLPHTAFSWSAQHCNDWLNPPVDWITTKYEQKRLAGMPTYLSFKRL